MLSLQNMFTDAKVFQWLNAHRQLSILYREKEHFHWCKFITNVYTEGQFSQYGKWFLPCVSIPQFNIDAQFW